MLKVFTVVIAGSSRDGGGTGRIITIIELAPSAAYWYLFAERKSTLAA